MFFSFESEVKKIRNQKKLGSVCGATRIRTGDTRIFSPLLYQLSYSTLITEAANINTSILSIKEKGIIIYNIHIFGKERGFMSLMIDIGNTKTKYAYFVEGV